MKKLLCILFSLALVVATLTPVALVNATAASTVNMSAEADEESYKVGDTVIVTFTIDQKLADVKSGNVVVSYDSSALQVLTGATDTYWGLPGVTMNTYDSATNKGAFAYNENTAVKKNASVFIISFTALKAVTDSSVSANFEYKTIDASGAEVSLATATSVAATVTIESAACEHNYVLKYDATQHWYECTKCGDKKDYANHSGGTATCESQAKCSVCGASYGELAAHTWANTKKADNSNLKSAATCKDYAVYYKVCSVCGAISETETWTDTEGGYAAHQYATVWSSDGSTHWHECAVCGAKSDEATHTYTQKHNDDTHWNECTTCGYIEGQTAHTFGEWVSTDDIQHWKECGCGIKAETADHVYDNACDTTCNVCGHERTVTHDYQWVSVNDNTQHEKKCSICGAVEEGTLGNHTGGTATETEQATCDVCGLKYGDTKGHTWVDKILTDNSNLKSAATCQSYAVYYKVCETCGAISTTETFEDVAGGYGNHDYQWADLPDVSGFHCQKCTVCGAVKDGTIGIHTGGTATCEKKAVCTTCNLEYGELAAHTWADTKKADGSNLKSPATCKSYAVYYKVCSVCGAVSDTETWTDTEGGYAAHSYATTWSSDGTNHWHECTVCGAKSDEAAHTLKTETDSTYHWQQCEVCGLIDGEKTVHTFGDYITTDADQHWKECACGVKADVADHTWVITHDETQHWYQCSVCGAIKDVVAHTVENIILDNDANLAKAATETEPAVYYKACTCGFIDGEQTFNVYKVTEGADANWNGTGTLGITAATPYEQFTGVSIDGQVVLSNNYTATKSATGATVITFTEEYLKTLANGEHAITIQSADGLAKTTITVTQSQGGGGQQGGGSGSGSSSLSSTAVQTGDNTQAILWIMVTVAAALALTVAIAAPRKRKH